MTRKQVMVRNEVPRNRLQQLRLERGWSRAALGRQANVHPSDVGRIENGRMQPYRDQLRRLARALDVPVAKAPMLLQEVEVDE